MVASYTNGSHTKSGSRGRHAVGRGLCKVYLEEVVEEREVSSRIYILVDIKKIKGSFSKNKIKGSNFKGLYNCRIILKSVISSMLRIFLISMTSMVTRAIKCQTLRVTSHQRSLETLLKKPKRVLKWRSFNHNLVIHKGKINISNFF